MFPYICEFHLYFDKKKNKKNAVIPTYPIVFPKKIRRKIKSFSYLPTLFDFSMLAETQVFFFLALFNNEALKYLSLKHRVKHLETLHKALFN